MNLKYYLRGLGLGIVVTAIIMGVATGGKKEALTNEEIIARAKELGMIENQVLTDYMAEVKAEEEAEAIEDTKEAEVEMAGKPEASVENRKEEGADEAGNIPEAEEEIIPPVEIEEEPTTFLIKKGETPYRISERLAAEGLVSSADDFDTFLLNNGYDRKIVASEYSIPANANEEMIAKIITGEKIE